MDRQLVRHYKTIATIQKVISGATTRDEALQGGLKAIVDSAGAECGVIWYLDKEDGKLRPSYWVGPVDLTDKSHDVGEGAVGRTFESQRSDRRFDFQADGDPATAADFGDLLVTSMVCVPFSSHFEDLGVIQFVNKPDGSSFTDEGADVMEIMAMMAAVAVEENDAIAEPWEPGSVLMSLKGVSCDYPNGQGTLSALDGVNLDVYEGELLAVVGEDGCGKTTLVNVMGGLEGASSGSIMFQDRDLAVTGPRDLADYRRRNVSFVFQDGNLLTDLTVMQNLLLAAEIAENPVNADDLLGFVGLADLKDAYPAQLTGGERQRASIARALVKRPNMVIADEPTGSLPCDEGVEVLRVLQEAAQGDVTVVIATHNAQVARMADRVVSMRGGRMHEMSVNRHPEKAVDLEW